MESIGSKPLCRMILLQFCFSTTTSDSDRSAVHPGFRTLPGRTCQCHVGVIRGCYRKLTRATRRQETLEITISSCENSYHNLLTETNTGLPVVLAPPIYTHPVSSNSSQRRKMMDQKGKKMSTCSKTSILVSTYHQE